MAGSERHREAEEAEVLQDPQQVAYREVYNTLQQFETLHAMLAKHLGAGTPIRLRPSQLLELHRVALAGLSRYAGVWRPSEVTIHGSRHTPPAASTVAEQVEEICDYVNEHWDKSPLPLAAYVMWKLNWIHPFTDGNGRTSRAVSYLVLNMKPGQELPGRETTPDQIANDKNPYSHALDLADTAWSEGRLDLTAMKELLSNMLAKQLLAVHSSANAGD